MTLLLNSTFYRKKIHKIRKWLRTMSFAIKYFHIRAAAHAEAIVAARLPISRVHFAWM